MIFRWKQMQNSFQVMHKYAKANLDLKKKKGSTPKSLCDGNNYFPYFLKDYVIIYIGI